MKHSEIMIAIREMDNGQDNYMVERDRRTLEQHGWMIVTMSRDFHFWIKVARLLTPGATVKRAELDAIVQEADRLPDTVRDPVR